MDPDAGAKETGVERDKALDMALGQIEKQFGKGAIMRMGADQQVKVASIPTGALSLDVALGIGGLPRGRVVEIYGPESSGKCIPGDTYVWTDRGLETVAELFDRCLQPATCTSRITDVRDLGVRVVNERGELEQVAALTHNNRRPVRRLRLQSGRTISATHNHPLRVVDEQGYLVWRQAGNIAAGDTVVSAAFGAPEAAEGEGLSEAEALLLGYLVAEGSLSSRCAVRFTNWDPEVGEEFTGLMESLFGVDVRCYDGKEYAVHRTAVRAELAERYGLDYVTAAGKTVPYCVRTGGHKAQRAFLSALFEGDGWIDASSTVGLGTASEQLARDVQLLLYGFGIPATVSSKYNATDDRDYWAVTVNPAVAHRFLEEIGFRSARRRGQVDAHFVRSPREPQFENVPNLAGMLRSLRDDLGGDREFDRICGDLFRHGGQSHCSRQRLAHIVAWVEQHDDALPPTSRAIVGYLRTLVVARYTYERVMAVEDGGEQPTFDLVLPQTHSFVANGVLSHNTTVALHAIAEAQQLGGIAAFIDAEHALDPVYAKALGVDVDALLVSQPDTGEQALEITDMLVRSGAVDIIVIDSVAALTPRAEIEGEMGDTHVGLQARLMSQALRKLAGTLSRSRTCAVFINQIREKVGVMFGSPETQPGGRALKFYSSVRLDVRRIESLKDGTDFVGNRVRVKVVKNKCIAAGTRVFDPTTGLTHRIEDIVDRAAGTSVWAADKRGQLHVKMIEARMDQGEQEVLTLGLHNGGTLEVTPDHLVLTEQGWKRADMLTTTDRVARPRRVGGFGDEEPVPPDHARMLGYLIGNGAVGGKTPIAFLHNEPELHEDAAAIAASLGCTTALDIHLVSEKRISPAFFGPDVSAEVVGNLLFGIWESDGWISREQRGGLRAGFATTSEQLAWQVHWLLLRWGVASTVKMGKPGERRGLVAGRRIQGKHGLWQVRVSGVDNLRRFTAALPMWGPKGQKLTALLADPALATRPGARTLYLSSSWTDPVIAHLRATGVTPEIAGGLVGVGATHVQGGYRAILGTVRLRRDRLERLAEALDDAFLREALVDELYYERINEISGPRRCRTFDIEVDDLHNFVANDVVVHNCASPFKQAEFDIMFGEGISKEGSILDMAVDSGIVKKAGAWFSYEGDQIGQGREQARAFLKEHADTRDEIYKRVTEHLGLVPTDVTGDEALDEKS